MMTDPPVRAGYGRTRPFLLDAAPAPRVAGVEFGGTKILVVAGRDGVMEGRPLRFPTAEPHAVMEWIVDVLRGLERQGERFQAIGLAAFGPLQLDQSSPDYGRLLNTPKPGWQDANLLERLQATFDTLLLLETDVNAAAIAEEAVAGGHRKDHAYITVGTGVGVGLVVNGRPVHGAGHPEAGHLLVRPVKGDSFTGVCAAHGACVEGMISGPALVERIGRPLENGDLDPEVWASAGDYLAQLCMALTLTVAPERIVLGGGVGSRPELLYQTRRHLHRLLGGYLERYRDFAAVEALLAPAALEHSGLSGALAIATASARACTGAA